MNIRELVEQAGLDWHRGWPVGDDEPNRFEVLVKLAIAHEREECAKLCESFDELHPEAAFHRCSAAIRARSNA